MAIKTVGGSGGGIVCILSDLLILKEILALYTVLCMYLYMVAQ